MELNGLRNWKENRVVKRPGRALEQAADLRRRPPRPGAERQREPDQATSFNEFVHEIRDENRSHVLFMPQYAQPWKHRIMQSTLDAIRDYPDFPEGSRRWDERVYHPDVNGIPAAGQRALARRSRAADVADDHPVRPHAGQRPFSGSLRFAWNESQQLHFALGEREAV